ncbi:hypothetical protein GA0061096_2187 [Fictibacillus enclensis]|nr:hypothetical protein GA0061096_2187 [Fictibacillus enclensis]
MSEGLKNIRFFLSLDFKARLVVLYLFFSSNHSFKKKNSKGKWFFVDLGLYDVFRYIFLETST